MRIRLPGLYIVLGLLLAGLIHIVAVLTLPYLAPRNANARLAALGPVNTMMELPPSTSGNQILPMTAPDVRYAFCRFDLSDGPVRLHVAIADDLWLIGLYTKDGGNFYALAGADMRQPQVDLIITTGDQTVEEAGVDAPEAAEDAVIVVSSPVEQGIAVVRAPLAGPSGGPRAEQALKSASCRPYSKAG